jgi:hypothetical protein
MSEGCVFCDQSWMRAAEIFIETPRCIFASTRDPDIRAQAGLAADGHFGMPGERGAEACRRSSSTKALRARTSPFMSVLP